MNSFKTTFVFALAAILAAGQSHFQTARASKFDKTDKAAASSKASRRTPTMVPGRLLVKYREGVSADRRNNLMMAAGAREDREIPRLGVQVIELPDVADLQAYAEVLAARPEVEFAEPDYLCYPVSSMVPDDPLYSSQWHLPAVSCPADAGMTSGSEQVTIALCDTGVDASHQDLAPMLVPGWNIVDNNSDTSPVSANGTWTAGTASAVGNNSIGLASPALNCRIMPVRVSSRTDGAALISTLAAGVVWAADHGARVASVSYMGAGSSLMRNAGKYIQDRGGVLVMAAGNTGTYCDVPDSPEIIVTSATDSADQVAGFSMIGPYVDLSAPGAGIQTTAPGNTYQAVNGTSCSTFLVARAVALMLSINPKLTPAQIDTKLKVTADDLGPAGWDPGYGWGRLNVGRALAAVAGMVGGTPDSMNALTDVIPPQVSFISPADGDQINGKTIVSITAIDDIAVTRVEFCADNFLMASWSTAPYIYKFSANRLARGAHVLKAIAYDAFGNSAETSINVTTR
jgi:hypothetical protein